MLFPSRRVCLVWSTLGWFESARADCRELCVLVLCGFLIFFFFFFFGLMSDALGHHMFQLSVGTSCLFGYVLETGAGKKKKRRTKRSK